MNDLSTEQIRRLLTIQKQIEKLHKEKMAIVGTMTGRLASKPKMSASARAKISKQVKKRWAERKAKGEKKL